MIITTRQTLLEATIKYVTLCAYHSFSFILSLFFFTGASRELASHELSRSARESHLLG